MYDAEKNNMWPQQHQRFMGPIPPHHLCLQSPSPVAPVPVPVSVPVPAPAPLTSCSSSSSSSSCSSSSSSLLQLDARANQRMDNLLGQQHPHHHQHHHHQHGVVELPMPSNPRASRNMAEKQRRDNLNANISTMAALVPAVAGSSRRMDKISILRLAAAYLRSQYTLGPGPESFLPRHYDFDLEQYIIENLVANAGFFLVVTTLGKIVYVSRYIENHLGHAQHELLGQSLYHFVCPDDCEELQRNLTPDGFQNSTSTNACGAANEDNSSSSDEPAPPKLDRSFTVQRRSFNIRMSQKAVNKREHGQYECLQISGQLRLANACRSQGTGSGRGTHREVSTTGNDIVFVGIARLVKKRTITELSLLEATKDEYVTRHLVDGRIIFCDHRISVVAGYMTEEVSGLSAFKFMHKEDVRWTIIALRQMYDRGEGFGSSCYRLLSKTGQFIYLRTHGYLEFDKDTQTVESFVCVNTLVSEKEGMKLVKEMKERFAAVSSGPAQAMIAPSTPNTLSTAGTQQVDQKATVEDPAQLEDVINHLISDLASPLAVDDRASPYPLPDNQYYKAKVYSHGLPPAVVQANKIGIKTMHCRSPPENRPSSYNVKTPDETERRNSVSSNESFGKIEELRENNNDAIAGPSFTGSYEETKMGIVEDTRFPVKSENHGVILTGIEDSSIDQNSTNTTEGIDVDIDVDIYRKSSNPGHAVSSVFKSSNNNLQEKRSPRKRGSQNSARGKRYSKQQQQLEQQQQIGNRTISTSPQKIDTRVSSTCEVVRNRERVSSSKVNDILIKGNNLQSFDETPSIFNPRKRSRSGEDFTGTSSISSKRKAVRMSNSFAVSNVEEDSDHLMYYGNSDPVNITGFIGTGSISSTDDLGGEENRLSVDIGSREEDDDIGVGGIDISIDDLAEGAGSCLESMDVYQRFNPGRILESSVSVQAEDEEEEDEEEEEGVAEKEEKEDDEEDGRGGEGGIGEEEMNEDLQEGKLSPSLDADPDLMKIFDGLQTVMCNGKTIDEANVNQFTASDHAVSEGIRRSQFQLEKSIALRESQLNVLKRDLDNPAALKLQAQRENFTQLEAEHNKYKQMLKTLQQDHLTLQANTQHNVGV